MGWSEQLLAGSGWELSWWKLGEAATDLFNIKKEQILELIKNDTGFDKH